MNDNISPQEYVIENFVPKNQLTIFSGDKCVGKTTLMASMIHALSTGSRFMGQETSKQECYLLTIEGEEHIGRMILAHDLATGIKSEHHYDTCALNLDTNADVGELYKTLTSIVGRSDNKNITVFIDGLLHYISDFGESAATCKATFSNLKDLLDHNPTVTIIATAYPDPAAGKIIAGSHALTAHASTIYSLGIHGGNMEVISEKVRFNASPVHCAEVSIYGDPSNYTDAQYLKY